MKHEKMSLCENASQDKNVDFGVINPEISSAYKVHLVYKTERPISQGGSSYLLRPRRSQHFNVHLLQKRFLVVVA